MAELVRLDHTKVERGALHYPVYVVGGSGDLSDPLCSRLTKQGDGSYVCSKSLDNLSIPGLPQIASDGDVLFSFRNGQAVRIALAKRANQNSLLVTEQCNNNCTFCSQPPRDAPTYFDTGLSALRNFQAAGEIGLTGGEPTLHWHSLLNLMVEGRKPGRTYHLLTHGRSFAKTGLIQELVTHKLIANIIFGIPIHGPSAVTHDAVTGSNGSWEETIAGLINLNYVGASLEVRVVMTQQVMPVLGEILALLHSILGSTGYVIALMRLEPTGWAKSYLNLLRPSAAVEGKLLESAIGDCVARCQSVRLYNYPLCLLPRSIRRYATQSISDWKNIFGEVCFSCSDRSRCSGLFASEREQSLKELEPIKCESL